MHAAPIAPVNVRRFLGIGLAVVVRDTMSFETL